MKYLFCIIILYCSIAATAQDTTARIEMINIMRQLSDSNMLGRGYVGDGQGRAAAFLNQKFSDLQLEQFPGVAGYVQNYKFSVNTFPGDMMLKVDGKLLLPGVDYIIDASSAPHINRKGTFVQVFDMGTVKSKEDFARLRAAWTRIPSVNLLRGVDVFCKNFDLNPHAFPEILPVGVFLIPQKGKMNWTVSTTRTESTVFYVADSVIAKRPKGCAAVAESSFLTDNPAKNIIGFVKGTKHPDSFIVFTAHYDHLGCMGKGIVFPGANDNASGTAFLLHLARYYKTHPQSYSVAFIAFSGEEAGLIGSKYYTEHPVFPLDKIRMLVNLDLFADATDGITVVNATEFRDDFDMMNQVNEEQHYLKAIKQRGKAANSDHYYFSEKGVHSFFIYANSGPGYYHDVFDKPASINMKYVEHIEQLLIDFVSRIQGTHK